VKTIVVAAAVCVLSLASRAGADLYWVSYEAKGTFPEEEGWQRHAYGGGAQRSFEDGCLVLDAGGVSGIIDNYCISGIADPGPGEVFRIEWRLRVDEAEYIDPAVVVSSYGHGLVNLTYTREAIYSPPEDVWIPIAPGVYHDYVLTTGDAVSYELAIDGEPVHAGQFVGPWWESAVTWGDSFYAATSVSRWDYFRFGVVPEPSAVLVFGLGALAVTSTRARRAWRNMP
jgi:hypothetical protein